MRTLQIEHGVRDYDRWKAAFDGDPVGREAGGVRSYRIARQVDDPNRVRIDLDFDTTGEAEAFHDKLRTMWAAAAEDLGLENPSGRILEVMESKTY